MSRFVLGSIIDDRLDLVVPKDSQRKLQDVKSRGLCSESSSTLSLSQTFFLVTKKLTGRARLPLSVGTS